jgi:Helix-turn-helix
LVLLRQEVLPVTASPQPRRGARVRERFAIGERTRRDVLEFLLAAIRRAHDAGGARGGQGVAESGIESMTRADADPGAWDVNILVHDSVLEVDVAPTVEPDRPRLQEPMEFGPWLRSRLQSRGMSQELAARRLGVSTRTVGRWVRGDTQPRFRDLARLREAFGPLPEG